MSRAGVDSSRKARSRTPYPPHLGLRLPGKRKYTTTHKLVSAISFHHHIDMPVSKRVRSPGVGDDESSKRVKTAPTTSGSTAGIYWSGATSTKQRDRLFETFSAFLNTVEDQAICGSERERILDEILAEAGPGSEYWTDASGATLLHIAARSGKDDVLRQILSTFPGQADERDMSGHTPLDTLRHELEKQRSQLKGMFDGFSQGYVECLEALADTQVVDPSRVSAGALSHFLSPTVEMSSCISNLRIVNATLRLKYGCTCGCCVGGFLSPRMSLSLKSACEDVSKALKSDLFLEGPPWDEVLNYTLRCYNDWQLEGLECNAAVRRDLANLFSLVASTMEDGRAPTRHNLAEEYDGRWG